MPARSRDIAALRAFAGEHARAHARLATPRPNAACACGASACRHHTARATCTGTTLLVLIHNPAVAEVWTLAEICQACAPLITHATVLAGGRTVTAQPGAGTTRTAPAAPAGPPPVAVGFSSPGAAGGEVPTPPSGRRRTGRGRPRGNRPGRGSF
ncbi:hypothetical protein ACH414_03715 [Streptomyces sp. NPDC020422]|uniref:hypothetical protein n=1 Tax=Streptomyces sp. NPDC020422 TaxID=3365074 RepID=UPI00379BE65D